MAVPCLEKFRTSLWCYTAVLGSMLLLTIASYTYISSAQSTTQSVFSFTATDVGIWYSMYEVGSIVSNILVSYFLSQKPVPKV